MHTERSAEGAGSLARRLGHEMGIDIPVATAAELDRFVESLEAWNARVNLTALRAPRDVAIKHLLDSLTAFWVGEWPLGARVVDVGTGGGLPGMVLKIARPDMQLSLVDAQRRRIDAVRAIGAQLGMRGVEPVHGRIEALVRSDPARWRERADVAVIRAVAGFAVACEYTLPLVRLGGWAVLMRGPDGEMEAAEAEEAVSALGGRIAEIRRIELPAGTGTRVLVGLQKVYPTPDRFPRREGIPARRPLGRERQESQ
ncbi:MAG TPA: 16S rRNA (guanine(527)-N(7))-methyltransferase RsmG [Limnochordia bacterium]